MGPPMRASKRSAARATALYEVREGLVERRPPPDALLAAWSDAIDANVQSPFGVRKLAAFDLAVPLPPHADLPWLDERSLLFYAAWRGRDPIVHSLLRARAEPCAGVTGVAAASATGVASSCSSSTSSQLAGGLSLCRHKDRMGAFLFFHAIFTIFRFVSS